MLIDSKNICQVPHLLIRTTHTTSMCKPLNLSGSTQRKPENVDISQWVLLLPTTQGFRPPQSRDSPLPSHTCQSEERQRRVRKTVSAVPWARGDTSRLSMSQLSSISQLLTVWLRGRLENIPTSEPQKRTLSRENKWPQFCQCLLGTVLGDENEN